MTSLKIKHWEGRFFFKNYETVPRYPTLQKHMIYVKALGTCKIQTSHTWSCSCFECWGTIAAEWLGVFAHLGERKQDQM